MVKINKDWDRWVKASVNNYLETQLLLLLPNFPIFFENVDKAGVQDWLEIRVDGPHYEPSGSGEWKAMVEINILINSLINEEPVYRIRNWTGACLQVLAQGDIPIKSLPESTTVVGWLQTKDLESHHYDKVADANVSMRQATVDVFAEVNFTET